MAAVGRMGSALDVSPSESRLRLMLRDPESMEVVVVSANDSDDWEPTLSPSVGDRSLGARCGGDVGSPVGASAPAPLPLDVERGSAAPLPAPPPLPPLLRLLWRREPVRGRRLCRRPLSPADPGVSRPGPGDADSDGDGACGDEMAARAAPPCAGGLSSRPAVSCANSASVMRSATSAGDDTMRPSLVTTAVPETAATAAADGGAIGVAAAARCCGSGPSPMAAAAKNGTDWPPPPPPRRLSCEACSAGHSSTTMWSGSPLMPASGPSTMREVASHGGCATVPGGC